MNSLNRLRLPVIALGVAGLFLSPAFGQCEEQDAQLQILKRQIASLQKQVLTLKAQVEASAGSTAAPRAGAPATAKATADANAAAKQRAAAARGAGRAEALALYDRVDQLLGERKIDAAKQALADFNIEHAGKPAAAWTRSLSREMTAVGKPAPSDWSIESWFQGESDVKLGDDGPTLVVFWESWCPHCRTEVPKMQALYDRYRGKGLQVVGVTRLTKTATAESVASFIDETAVSYPIAKETGALAEYFAVKGIPAAAVVKDGQIVWRGHPMRLKPDLLESWM